MSDVDTSLRCGKCGYWLGESTVSLVRVEHVSKGNDVTIAPPRDLRLCKQCSRVNVFIARADLDLHRGRRLAFDQK